MGKEFLERSLENCVALMLEDQRISRFHDLKLNRPVCGHRQVVVMDQYIFHTPGKGLVPDRGQAAGLERLLVQGLEDLCRVKGIAVVKIISRHPSHKQKSTLRFFEIKSLRINSNCFF